MNRPLSIFLILIILFSTAKATERGFTLTSDDTVIVRTAVANNKMSAVWKAAIIYRMSGAQFDSLSAILRELTTEEKDWIRLIESKTRKWDGFIDSLNTPFENVHLCDTIYVMLGYLGWDDGFTYQHQTVCFDLTALYDNYGKASLPVNDNRMDRLFAHELTHLFHKEWARKNNLHLSSFKDSILWECMYEGIGMYRSLSDRWLPKNDSLPLITQQVLAELSPVFTDKMVRVLPEHLTEEEKVDIHSGLSRGPVNKKWGAFPLAIWLALEANGDDRNLIPWINKGPQGVMELSKKYCTSILSTN